MALARHRDDPISDIDLSFWYHATTNESIEAALGARSALSNLVAHLSSEPVRKQLSADFGISLGANAPLSLSLTRFGPGAYLSPHTDWDDSGTYALTVLIFLNQYWHPYLGGSLVLSDGDQWQSFFPQLGRTVCFRPSADTVHYVEHIHPATPTPRFAISGWYFR